MKTLKITMLTACSIVLCLFLTACAQDAAAKEEGDTVEVVETQKTSEELNREEQNNAVNSEVENDEKDKNNSEHASKQEKNTYSVKLTYPSTDFIVNGNEENKTITEKVDIQGTKDTIVTEVLDRLAKAPATDEAEETGLNKYDYSKSSLQGTEATVDLSGDLQGGSLEEDVLVSSIVNSLLSVDGVKSVQFTVNGEHAETLMGHVDISKPFTNFVK